MICVKSRTGLWLIPASRENENCGTFTPTFPHPARTSTGSTFSPTITRVAIATKSKSSVLETNGNERDTLTLHSITFSSLCYNKTKTTKIIFLTYYILKYSACQKFIYLGTMLLLHKSCLFTIGK